MVRHHDELIGEWLMMSMFISRFDIINAMIINVDGSRLLSYEYFTITKTISSYTKV